MNKRNKLRRFKDRECGSLALEQVLFIGAVVAMAVGVYSFYGELGQYFSNFKVENLTNNYTKPVSSTN